MEDWRDIKGYYPTNIRCIICNKSGRNGIDPRFSFVVCEEHSKIPPAYVQEYITCEF